MLRVSSKCLTASVGLNLSEKASKMTFAQQYNKAIEDPENVLGGKSYAFLREQLVAYRGLQGEYAVKQSDVERARKAGNMCGLEFTGNKNKLPGKDMKDVL